MEEREKGQLGKQPGTKGKAQKSQNGKYLKGNDEGRHNDAEGYVREKENGQRPNPDEDWK